MAGERTQTRCRGDAQDDIGSRAAAALTFKFNPNASGFVPSSTTKRVQKGGRRTEDLPDEVLPSRLYEPYRAPGLASEVLACMQYVHAVVSYRAAL